MTPFRPLLTCCLAATLLVGVAAGLAPQDEPPPPATPPQVEGDEPRVIVRLDRFTRIPGHVVLEDDAVIVVRTREGKLESFGKGRIAEIIRLTEPVPGQLGTVTLETGETRKGIIVEDEFDHVIVEIEGVRTKIRREAVQRVVLEPSFEERYRTLKASVTPERIDLHLMLCRWLYEQKQYALAKLELDELIANRRHPDALRLLGVVEAQLALLSESTARASETDGAARERRSSIPEGIVSPADVNIIRVFEIDFDRPPRLHVSRDTTRELLERYRTHELMPQTQDGRDRLFRAEALDLVEIIFALRARELYPSIEVRSEPVALNIFRQRVHNTWLMNNCATSQCHGGPDAGRFRLENRRSKDATVRYANLLTLERQQLDPSWPLINYDRPLDSLIIQHGLPRARARNPHPPAEGWTPAFRSTEDRGVRSTVRWISGMLQPRPEYPVEFIPLGDRVAGKDGRTPTPR